MKRVTIIGLVICLVILAGVEVYALMTPKQGDTISEILFSIFDDYPILLYLSGVITGHIVFPLSYDTLEYIRSRRK